MADVIGGVYNSKISFEGKLLFRFFGVTDKAACMTGFCFDIYLDCSKMATEGHQRLIEKSTFLLKIVDILVFTLSGS